MRTLIIVRHSDVPNSKRKQRERQIRSLQAAIATHCNGNTVLLCAHSAAVEHTARMLVSDADPVRLDELQPEGFVTLDVIARVCTAIAFHAKDANVAIIVSYFEITDCLPSYVGEQIGIDIPATLLESGTGIVIDLQEKTHRYVP